MSLLVTSSTMGKQPDRLLNKGPQYLRTRTNASLFAQNKKSAVELLAASKAQFYKTSVDLDKHQDLAFSPEQKERYSGGIKKKEPLRSKSEYDLSQLHLTRTEDDSDENNNDISDDSITFSTDNFAADSSRQHHQNISVNRSGKSKEEKEASLIFQSLLPGESASNVQIPATSLSNAVNLDEKPQTKLTFLCSAISSTHAQPHIYENIENKLHVLKDETDSTHGKKPVPLPRKLKEKPVPPPRKFSNRTPLTESPKESDTCISEITLASSSFQSPSLSNKFQETTKINTESSFIHSNAKTKLDNSHTDSSTQRFINLCATSAQSTCEKSHQSPKELNCPEHKTEISDIYTAKSIFIIKPDAGAPVQARRITTIQNVRNAFQIPSADDLPESSHVNTDRKRCPDVRSPDLSTLAKTIKREKRIIPSDSSGCKPGIVSSLVFRFLTAEKSNSASGSIPEMSIESVDQAVYDSEISAVPAVFMDANHMQEVDEEAREVTRASSSLSGKLEQQSSSPLSMSPTPQCSAVPRSHSDISCHLEGQHSRDSSIVSNHSRLSCASVGTDLENFFNQMGLEKGILDPINRLKELQTSEVFDSMSSLDSHDAASICSTYSRSEQEWSDSQSMERSQQQTSIVERNARIIKWLCNVRKAKSQPQKSDNATTGKV